MGYAKHKGTPIVDDDPINTAFGERTRLNDISNAFRAIWMAGSRQGLIEGDTDQDADNYIDLRLDSAIMGGYTLNLIVEVLTLDAGTTIQPKLWDVTSTPAIVTTTGGAASASLTWARQTLGIAALNSGVKFYRVRATKSNAAAGVRMLAYLEITG